MSDNVNQTGGVSGSTEPPNTQPPATPSAEQGYPAPHPPASAQPAPSVPPAPPAQPAPPMQPAPGFYQQPPAGNGKAMGALMCGIFAIVLAWLVLPGIVLGIVAIVLGAQAAKGAVKDGKATGGKVCGIIGLVLAILAGVFYLATAFGFYQTAKDSPELNAVVREGAAFDSETYNTVLESGSQAEAAVITALDKVTNGDPAFLQAYTAAMEEDVRAKTGYHLTDLGVEPSDFMSWLNSGFNYHIIGVSTNGEDKAQARVYVTLRGLSSVYEVYDTNMSEFSQTSEAKSLDEAALMAKAGEVFRAAIDEVQEDDGGGISVTAAKEGDTWVADESEIIDNIREIYNFDVSSYL